MSGKTALYQRYYNRWNYARNKGDFDTYRRLRREYAQLRDKAEIERLERRIAELRAKQ